MTRRSKREIERALDRFDGNDDGDVDVTSDVVTVREGDDGDLVVEDGDGAPEGYRLGPELKTGSDAVQARMLLPTDESEDGHR